MKYQVPTRCFFRLPNEIFQLRLELALMIYACLVCCSGSQGKCWLSLKTMHKKLGISTSTVQGRIKLLKKRKFIFVCKHNSIKVYENRPATLNQLHPIC